MVGAHAGTVAKLFAGSLRRPQASSVHQLLDQQLHLKGDDRVLHLTTLQQTGNTGSGKERVTTDMKTKTNPTGKHHISSRNRGVAETSSTQASSCHREMTIKIKTGKSHRTCSTGQVFPENGQVAHPCRQQQQKATFGSRHNGALEIGLEVRCEIEAGRM